MKRSYYPEDRGLCSDVKQIIMIRNIVFFLHAVLFFMLGCNRNAQKPTIQYSARNGIFILQDRQDAGELNLLFVNANGEDTIRFQGLNRKDTIAIEGLECSTKYSCYYKYENETRYSFLEAFDYHPSFCKENFTFQQVKSVSPGVNYLIQDFKQGSIYRLGKHGHMIDELDSLPGFIRGFDKQDSLLVWCSDSSQLAIKNLQTLKKRYINFDSTIKVHHDLILHYPYLAILYNRKKYREFKSYKVIEEGIIKMDLRTTDLEFWSIHDFLSDSILPLGNAKGSFVTAHGNSVDVDGEGNYYISFRDFNQVWKVSSDLSKVHYRIGLNANSFKIDGDFFIGQHSVDIIGPDLFYLFDNGSTGGKVAKSRVVRVRVDPKAKIYQVKNILSLPDSLSTIRMGSVHSLDNHLVVSTFHEGLHILEIDTTGVVKNHLKNSRSHAIKVLPLPQH